MVASGGRDGWQEAQGTMRGIETYVLTGVMVVIQVHLYFRSDHSVLRICGFHS